ncbi:MAG: bifunctional heptose 7-phosphate kinase/heptose 1-phosphate adenyltransferase [Pseudomonadota bacterium]|nr:bifunctional heptose 7-phosphate kinase/heptose 1-phosphate adenyltransferase [Pseudomonadota bacterium]
MVGNRVLVVGDVMLDVNHYGTASRLSPEAPVPILRTGIKESRLGGAANVARNCSSLNLDTSLMGIVGKDENSSKMKNLLAKSSISSELLEMKGEKTITKVRYWSESHQIFREDIEETFSKKSSEALLGRFRKIAANFDLIIFSDYDKGSLRAVREMIGICGENKVPTIVDPKRSDFSVYSGASIIKPNYKEFCGAKDFEGSAETDDKFSYWLREHYSFNLLLVTLGREGMKLYEHDRVSHFRGSESSVADVTGAGDTVTAILGASLLKGSNIKEMIEDCLSGASVAVKKRGTYAVSWNEIEANRTSKVYEAEYLGKKIDEAELEAVRESHPKQKIVFTNGCFDLLHCGHLDYLMKSKAMGDLLVVGLNDDNYIIKNKNRAAPANNLEYRLKALSNLECVDLITVYDEATPEKLISRLRPDILVKGADYKPSEIAGHDQVLSWGGEVKTVEFRYKLSSSDILALINKND